MFPFPGEPLDLSDISDEEEGFEELLESQSYAQNETRIVLIGKTGAGKSETGNTLIGNKVFISKLSGKSVTSMCKRQVVNRFGKQIIVVDTPGLFDTNASQKEIYKEIQKSIFMTAPGIHAVILVIKIGRFTDEEQKTVDYFRKMFGDDFTKYLMIIFTGKDELEREKRTLDEYVDEATEPLIKLVTQCNRRYVALDNRSSDEDKETFTKHLLQKIDEMVHLNGGKCYTTKMFKKAESILRKRQEEVKKKMEEEKKQEREEMEKRIKEKFDCEMQQCNLQIQGLSDQLQQIKLKEEEDKKNYEKLMADARREEQENYMAQLKADREARALEQRALDAKQMEIILHMQLENARRQDEERERARLRDEVMMYESREIARRERERERESGCSVM